MDLMNFNGIYKMKPYDITRIYGCFYIDDLFKLVIGKPVVKVALTQFKFIMNNNYWFDPDNEPPLSEFIEHYKRVIEADLKYPIIALSDRQDVLDGIHRLTKAFVNEYDYINVIYITKKELMTINHKKQMRL